MIRRNIISNPGTAAQYVTGVMALKDPSRFPWPGQSDLSIYDFFVFFHHESMFTLTPPTQNTRNAAHSGPIFLPWHRYMLLMFEVYMRDAIQDDDFRLPYWDWAGDALLPDPRLSPLWSPTMLGRFVAPDFPVRVEGDPFSAGSMRLAGGRLLERQLGQSGRLSRRQELRDTVRDEMIYDSPDYEFASGGFRSAIEGERSPGHHNFVHGWVGGDMLRAHSPNDPAFFLVHANVDRAWSAWQQAHGQNTYAPTASESADLFRHRIGDPMFTLFNHSFDIAPEQMFDHSTYYDYDDTQDLNPLVA